MRLTIRTFGLSAGIVAVAVALAACGNNPSSPAHQISSGAQQMGRGITAMANDTAITSQVKARLAANTGLNSFDIHVTTVNGIVTLTGTVDSEATRETAARVVLGTGGVKGVDNKLKVKSSSDGD
ncbi:MAG: BON domain-containing protein [Gammaproteobacteria bacterium]